MKILVLCERVDAEGGTETYLRTLLPALTQRGHTVRVLARSVTQPDAYSVATETIAWSDEHDPASPEAAVAVSAAARAFAPDVAAVHNVLDAGVLEAVAQTVPRVVHHLHDHRPFCPNGDRVYPQGHGICSVAMSTTACAWHALVNGCGYGPRRSTLTLIARRKDVARAVVAADATIALSQYVAELARRNGVAATKLYVVAPPLDGDAFATAPLPRPDADAVLFAGRVVPSKGARSLVRALARLPRRSRPLLRIAGNGPDLDATLDEARSRAVKAEALGRLEPVAMRHAYDAATLVAIPSLWGEPFGLVGIEAFARARPVVGYDAGGIREWLGTSGAGRVVPLHDEAALASAIGDLCEPRAWNDAHARAFSAAQSYRADALVARIETIYAGSETPVS